tara:strand:- start:3077 stop:3706 length:630 start_codon:yes stop_codon:yes gene_type:complete
MKVLLLFSISYLAWSLKPHQFPNGKLVKFSPNKMSPSKDLVRLEPGKASIITRNWLENIILEVMNDEKSDSQKNKNFKKRNIFEYDNLHIVTHINQLETHIQETFSVKKKNDQLDLFLAWKPKGNHGRNEVLFIIFLKLIVDKKELVVKEIVQSPFWDPVHIDSNYLKMALEDLNSQNDNVTLVLDYLYENDIRFKLAWSTWNLDKDQE